MQLMMIKINGNELIEHNFDNAAKIFLSTAAHPMHTTTAHNFHRLNLRHHHLTGKKMRRLQTDVHLTTGLSSDYKWGNVWGWTENTPPLAYDPQTTTDSVKVAPAPLSPILLLSLLLA
jgi:hypothetical protein